MYCKYAGRDIYQRLDSTICMYNDIPVFVSLREDNENQLSLFKLSQQREVWKVISPDDPQFDIASLNLGYVNFDDRCVYAMRSPLRNYKQGVTQRNTHYYDIPDQPGRNTRSNRYRFEIFCGRLNKSLMNVFPSKEQVINSLRNRECFSRACSREIAFKTDELGLMSVYYKNTLVGHILPNSNIVSVPNGEMSWVVSAYLDGFGIQYD